MKYALNDAPHTGKGQWTWPLTQIEDPITIEKVIKRGIKLQEDMKDLNDLNIDRETSNLQLLWETFKSEIKKITINQNKKTYHKITSKICSLEKDQAILSAHPDFDIQDDLRTSEAFIASELKHLEKVRANAQKDSLKAKLTHHGKKPGGIWSKLGKVKCPQDPIYRLKVPNANPMQYERHSKGMAKIACDYHESLQHEDLDPYKNQAEHENRSNAFLQHISGEQRIPEHDKGPMNWPVDIEQMRHAILISKSGSTAGIDGCPYELWKKLISEHEK